MLLRSQSFAIISFLALTLGIGVPTPVFAVVNNIPCKPLRAPLRASCARAPSGSVQAARAHLVVGAAIFLGLNDQTDVLVTLRPFLQHGR